MAYINDCKDILDLFRLAGKEVPHVDSNMGRAVQILQSICDEQNHTIPDANDEAEEIKDQLAELESVTFEYFSGNAIYEPAVKRTEKSGYEFTYEAPSFFEALYKAAFTAGVEIDVAQEFFDALEELEAMIDRSEDDYRFEFDGAEYRLIKSDEDVIWPIYTEEVKNLVEDCYSDVLKLDEIPDFIAISVDWEQTAKNAYADGYGHQFSGYDGSEEEAAGYYIFRTN